MIKGGGRGSGVSRGGDEKKGDGERNGEREGEWEGLLGKRGGGGAEAFYTMNVC